MAGWSARVVQRMAVRSFWPRRRVRRLPDAAWLALAVIALTGLVAVAVGAPDLIDGGFPDVLSGLPRFVVSAANVIFSVGVLGVMLAVAVEAFRGQRFALTSAVLGSVLGVVLGLAVATLVDRIAGDTAKDLLVGRPDESVGLPFTVAVATVVASDLRRYDWLRVARLVLAGAVVCALLLGSLTPAGAAYALLIGAAAGLAIRVAAGVVPARPPHDVVRNALTRAGFDLTTLVPVEEAAGRIRYTGRRPDDVDLRITVVDPDRRGLTLAHRGWRMLRLRSAAVGRPALSLRGQVERQALTAGLAQAADIPGPRVLALLAAGPALVLVEEPLAGTPMAAGLGADPTDEGAAHASTETATGRDDRADSAPAENGAKAAAAFAAARRLHDAGLAHGSLTADSIVLTADGRAGFAEFRAAQPAATELQRELDVVALLVVVAEMVGADEAVAALRTGYRSGSQARLAALLQPLALPRPLRRSVRGTTLLDDLRRALTGETDREPHGETRGEPVGETHGGIRGESHGGPHGGPEGETHGDTRGETVAAPRLVRLRARTVITVAGGTLAAHILATQLSSVGLGSALRSASFAWLAVALFGSAVTYVGAALVTQAFVPKDLPLGRTTMVQLASSFLALVTPPAVGHVGLTVRYLQRSGVPVALATASVAVKEVFTIVVTVIGLIVCAWLSGVSAVSLSLLPSGKVLAVLLIAGAVVAVVAIVPPTRRLVLGRLQPLLRRTVPQLVEAVSQPRRVAAGLTGVLLLNAGNVLALGASLRAFSATLAIPVLVVVFLAASALGSAAPTPGGLGAVEAALVGGLTAVGVAVAPAITAVLAYRAVTFWLPAPLGWLAFVGLQRRGRL